MDKFTRIRKALAQEDVDRLPYSFWTHFPNIDLYPQLLAENSIKFARQYDLDFLKAMPNGNFCTEDWGVVSDFSQIASGGVAKVVSQPIVQPSDWQKIILLPITEGVFARELQHLELLCRGLSDRPILATTFSPLTVLQKIGGEQYRTHLATDPQLILDALENIALTLADFVKKAIDIGCAGVFFATQESSFDFLTEELFLKFGKPFDEIVLKAANGGWYNVIHMHGENIMFNLLQDYPVSALNWHIGETEPKVADYCQNKQNKSRKPIVGGIIRSALTNNNYQEIAKNIQSVINATQGRGLIVSQACVIRYPINPESINFAIKELLKYSN